MDGNDLSRFDEASVHNGPTEFDHLLHEESAARTNVKGNPPDDNDDSGEAIGRRIRGGSSFHWRLSASDPGPDPCCRWTLVSFAIAVALIAVARGIPSLFDGGAASIIHVASNNRNAEEHAAGWLMFCAALIGALCGLSSAIIVRVVLQMTQGAVVSAGVYGTVTLLGIVALAAFVQLQFLVGFLVLLIASVIIAIPFCCPARVRFAEAFVEVATTVISDFPGLLLAAATAIGVQVLFLVLWALAVIGIAALAVPTDDPRLVAIDVLVTFSALILFVSLFWVTGTVSNLVSVATARITALWYISGVEGDPETMAAAVTTSGSATPTAAAAAAASGHVIRRQLAGGSPATVLKDAPSDDWKTAGRPVYQASIWASTAALGPVAFGSLIVAIIQMLRVCCSRDDDNLAAACCGFILDWIESMLRYYNSYVYAVLGTAKDPKQTLSFTRAASVVNSITVSGSAVSAIFNDWLIDLGMMLCTVLATLMSLVLGLLTGALVGLLAPTTVAFNSVLGVCAITAVLVGIVSTMVLLGVVTGSVKALFVIWVASAAYLSPSDRSRPVASLGAAVESNKGQPSGGDLELVAMRHGPGRVSAVKKLEAAWQSRVDSDSSSKEGSQ